MASVLLVEDEDVERKLIDSVLRNAGHQVLLAGNGAQAIIVAADKKPEIILSDINMPKMSGMELCGKIRAMPELAGSYIILITAYEKEGTKAASLDAGADDYLRKPVDKEDLLIRVEIGSRILAMRKDNEALRERAVALQKTQDTLVAALDALVRGMEEAAVRIQRGDPHAALGSLDEANGAMQRVLEGIDLAAGGGGG